jgi:hypothetical protein
MKAHVSFVCWSKAVLAHLVARPTAGLGPMQRLTRLARSAAGLVFVPIGVRFRRHCGRPSQDRGGGIDRVVDVRNLCIATINSLESNANDPEPNSAVGNGVVDQSGGSDILDPNPNGFEHGCRGARGGFQSGEHLSCLCKDGGP